MAKTVWHSLIKLQESSLLKDNVEVDFKMIILVKKKKKRQLIRNRIF